MSIRVFPVVLLLALAAQATVAAAPLRAALARAPARPAYVSGTADLPLMPGLHELRQTTVVFDAPSGLVVEADAIGRGIAPAAILRFYRATLPQLGWREQRPLIFVRDGERLQLTIGRRRSGQATVHFDLVPG